MSVITKAIVSVAGLSARADAERSATPIVENTGADAAGATSTQRGQIHVWIAAS